MNVRPKIDWLTVALAAALVAAALCIACGLRHGESQEDLIARCIAQLGDQDRKVQEEAEKALVGMGKAAVPALAEALICNGEVNAEVAEALGDIGLDAAEAIPALIRTLGIESHGGATALWKIGSATMPSLVQCIRSGPPKASAQAIVLLADFGGPALPYLIELLDDENPEHRATAVAVLGSLKDPPPDRVSRLLRATSDTDPRVRANAIFALRFFQYDTPEVTDALLRALRDDDLGVRKSVLEVYGYNGAPPIQLIPGLLPLLSDKRTASQACDLLYNIGPSARGAIPALINALDQPGYVKYAAARALCKIDPTIPELRPALIQVLASDNYNEWAGACVLLRDIDPPMPDALPLLWSVLTRCLMEPDAPRRPFESIAVAVAASGGDMGAFLAQALKATPPRSANADRRWDVNLFARLIAESETRNDGAVKDVVDHLALNDLDTCLMFCSEFGPTLGESGKAAMPTAISYLDSNEGPAVKIGCKILRNIGPAASEALPKLQELLNQGNPCVREAIDAIKASAPDARTTEERTP